MLACPELLGSTLRSFRRIVRHRPLHCPQSFSRRGIAASVLVRGESEGEAAATQALAALGEKLADREDPSFTLWFAKGYGARAQPIAKLLQDKLGKAGVVIGSSAEAGVIGDGDEVQEETFALSVLSIWAPGVRIFPFYSAHMASMPDLSRGGSWSELRASAIRPSVLAFCSLPVAEGMSPQGWCTMLDQAVYNCTPEEQPKGSHLPTVIGGLTVGHHIFIDGVQHKGGAFGVAFLPDEDSGASFDAVVCQGAVPFGPTLEITGVSSGHIITELDGKNPKEVLEPLLNGPQVPGTGHSMAGVFLNSTGDPLATTVLSGRPNCVVRPIHAWTPEGHVVVSPIMDDMPYVPGLRIQMHCMNSDLALEDLRMRAGSDFMAHGGSPPDAAIIISCGARGVSLYEKEGVESKTLRSAWGSDVPTTGFFAGGEIGPVGARTFMHGYTTSCLFIRLPSK